MSTLNREQQLANLAAEYRARREALRRDLTQTRSADFAEQASERENDEVLNALLLETEQALIDVQHAQERLASGEYGCCKACGEDIQAARLEAMPLAELCIACAQKAEHA
ncbi:TraR/DksA family transcriptional regulator [Atopomonas hussainii]|uniref:TraR/DksA family transcriptional regulator n=1 Tax=Atopomonas hussainii TaxID=1429083 RepID=UPI0008FFF86C|nr:TraR/DksA C4-type zinc finger protein [Atopomonas hussainii]